MSAASFFSVPSLTPLLSLVPYSIGLSGHLVRLWTGIQLLQQVNLGWFADLEEEQNGTIAGIQGDFYVPSTLQLLLEYRAILIFLLCPRIMFSEKKISYLHIRILLILGPYPCIHIVYNSSMLCNRVEPELLFI
jgi:hypothetical protein